MMRGFTHFIARSIALLALGFASACAPAKFSAGPIPDSSKAASPDASSPSDPSNPSDPASPSNPANPGNPSDPANPGNPAVCDPKISATCKDPGGNPYVLMQKTATASAPVNMVDVLLVIDDSVSMSHERANLAMRLASLTGVLDQGSVLDWRLCFTTTNPGFVTDSKNYGMQTGRGGGRLLPFSNGAYAIDRSTPNYQSVFTTTMGNVTLIDDYSNDEQGILATRAAVLNKDTRCFRQDAALAVVLMSDEDEYSAGGWDDTKDGRGWHVLAPANLPENAVAAVTSAYGAQKKFVFNSIVIRSGDKACYDAQASEVVNGGNPAAFYGRRYEALSQMTSGIVGSVCKADYGAQLTDIGSRIKETLDSVTLDCAPVGNIALKLNPEPAAPIGYSVVGSKVLFKSSVPAGTLVKVDYFCPAK